MRTLPRTTPDASPPASHQPTPVTSLRIAREWSYANDQPLEIDVLLTRANSEIRRPR